MSLEAARERGHFELLVPEDQQFLRETFNSHVVDPGLRTKAQLRAMTPDHRLLYNADRAAWHAALPLVNTRAVKRVMLELEMSGTSADHHEMHSQRVSVLDGDPGVGKSMIARYHAANEMGRLARLHYLRTQQEGTLTGVGLHAPRSEFRPVLYLHLDGAVTKSELLRTMCARLNWPVDRDVPGSLARAMKALGTKLVVIDELQFVNFDGKTGRQVHNALKWITNNGVRLVLSGNDIDWVLGDRGGAERESSRRQSRGRWIPLSVPPMPYATKADRADWSEVLNAFEQRLRLAGPQKPGWLSEDLAAYTWTSTLGYLNSLTTLILNAASRASLTKTEVIDRDLLDRITLEGHPQDGRRRRLALLDAGEYRFSKTA